MTGSDFRPHTSGLSLRQRLAYFLIGTAISCFLVGYFLQHRAAARAEAARQQQTP